MNDINFLWDMLYIYNIGNLFGGSYFGSKILHMQVYSTKCFVIYFYLDNLPLRLMTCIYKMLQLLSHQTIWLCSHNHIRSWLIDCLVQVALAGRRRWHCAGSTDDGLYAEERQTWLGPVSSSNASGSRVASGINHQLNTASRRSLLARRYISAANRRVGGTASPSCPGRKLLQQRTTRKIFTSNRRTERRQLARQLLGDRV